jgi:UDP-glucose 4-epimerase
MGSENQTVLVTGGCGFIGSHLVEQLVGRGFKVTVADNFANSTIDNLARVKDDVEVLEMNVNSDTFKQIVADRNFDVIYHLAANAYVPPSVKDPIYDFENNLVSTIGLLETIRRAELDPKVIVASSAAVYGNPVTVPITEEMITDPISPYGVGKLAMERYTDVYSRVYGMRTASARFFSAYGPRQKKQIVYDFIGKLKKDPTTMVILGDGTQMRDLVFVEDIVQALLVIMDNSPLDGTTYNVATGVGHTTTEIAQTIVDAMGLDAKFTYTGSVRPGDPHVWIADITRIRGIGYEPTHTLAQGIKKTIEWYEATH